MNRKLRFFVVASSLLICISVLLQGCSNDSSLTSTSSSNTESSIVQNSGSFEIQVVSAEEKRSVSSFYDIGTLHNGVLKKFHEKYDVNGPKITDPTVFFDLMDESLHEVVDTSVFDVSKTSFQDNYVPVLFELREFGAIDVFSCEQVNPHLIGLFFRQKGWVSVQESYWIEGFYDAFLGSETASEALLSINEYTFNNGLPVPDSVIGIMYNVTVHSLTYWSDSSKWSMPWRGVVQGISDGLCAAAGALIGGGTTGGPGAIVGGVYLGAVGSGAVHMMYEYWDEMHP